MIEAKASYKDGFHILTDEFKNPNDWEVEVYIKNNQKRIQFNTEDGPVNFPLSDVIEYLDALLSKEMEVVK